jgi:hypothetical protein
LAHLINRLLTERHGGSIGQDGFLLFINGLHDIEAQTILYMINIPDNNLPAILLWTVTIIRLR